MLPLMALCFIALTVLPAVVTMPLAARLSSLQSLLHLSPQLFIDKDVRAELKNAEIIPDVLDDFHPQIHVDVFYPSSHTPVNLGNNISPSNVSSAPVFEIHDASTLLSNRIYTLVLTDPDATSRSNPVKAEMCHWIVTDISTQELISYSTENVEMTLGTPVDGASNRTELVSYLPPSPPPKTGSHRYVFVLLASEAEIDSSVGQSNITKPVERPHWGYGKVGKGVRKWAKENKLTVVGANFFYSKNKEQ
ncbi:hypothetical protein MMC07_008014 [Pseudocyphellaria aurata]|nr:hypothetical protein [Pseudocyphellaria aurata]